MPRPGGEKGSLVKWNTTLSQCPCSQFNHGKSFPSAATEIITFRIKHGVTEQATIPWGAIDMSGLTSIISFPIQWIWKGLQMWILFSPFGMSVITACSWFAAICLSGATWPDLSSVLLPLLPPVTALTLETCPAQLPRSPETLCAGSSFSPPVSKPLDPNFFLTYTSTIHHHVSPHSPLASFPSDFPTFFSSWLPSSF